MAPFGNAEGLVARSELRRRWVGLLALALFVGLVGAVTLSAFAGARRTATALDRFEAATLARDARVIGKDDDTTHDLAQDLDGEPWVAAAGEFVDYTLVAGTDVVVTLYSGTDDVFSNEVDRPLVLDGRMPRADAPDEIAIDEVARDLLDVEVGDRIPMTSFDPDDLQCLIRQTCPFQGIPGPPLELDVVGVIRDVDAFATTEDPTPTVTGSPAFNEQYRGEVGSTRAEVLTRLEDDGDIDRLEAFMDDRPGTGTIITPEDDFAGGAQDAVDVLGTALVVFALVTSASGTFAMFLALTRQVDAAAASTPSLPALGMTRWGWARASSVPSVAAVVVGAVLAMVGAGLVSGWFPIGFADRIEPDPGLRLDPLVLLGGGLLIILVLGAWTLAAGRRRCALGRPDEGWTPRLAWAPLTVAAGGRLAFGRGKGRAAGPMRSAMIGIAVGTIGAIAATFVLVSLNDLVDDPARWGLPWDGQVTYSDPSVVDSTIDQLGDDDLVDGAALLETVIVQAGGEELSGYAFTSPDDAITPTVRRGRLPEADDEVALGEQSMDDLDVDIGDTLTVDGATDEDPDTDEPDVDLEVVGAVVLPTYNDPKPALGSVLTPDGLDRVRRGDPLRFILVDFEDGVTADEAESHLLDEYGLGFLGPILPPQLTNLDEARTVVEALIAFFVALALIGLLQALALSRRRQVTTIAVWRALGFVPPQVRRSVLWQSALVTLVAVGVGVPLGLYVGQVAWRLAVQNVGVVDDPTLPVLPAALALPAALMAAVVLALVPAWLAARGEPARDLHAE
jgi:hypothetical protein